MTDQTLTLSLSTGDVVIRQAFAGKLGDPLDVQGRQVRAQADDNIAGRQRKGEGGTAIIFDRSRS